MPNNTIYLKNYQAPVFSVGSVSLNFDLYDDHALVKNHMEFTRLAPGILRLNGDELELVDISMNDKILAESAYTLDQQDIIINDCPDQFSLTITTRIRPQDNTRLSGLYRSNSVFCTQCEAEGFRRMTFFPDRSDVLSTYTTRISAVKTDYPVLLSNGNLIDSGDLPDGRHWVVWQDPFKKPSYLFALVAGQLGCVKDQFVTCSGKPVELRIYVEPGQENRCQHALDSLKKAMRWDEEQFGREYDLSIFMIVAVSDFNMGAMENKGLNIFNSKYILARPDTASDQDYAGIESVVAHEYFHNWTGNRITCRDWFQLSLKEGLTVYRDQEFSRDMNSRDVNRILDVKALRNTQFPEDAGSLAHPVRPDSYQEINNFYTATIYNKGAEVIRMQETLLGKKGFRLGMDLYFQRHDGQAVTIDDFVACMEDANGVNFSQFKRWYSQAGTPKVNVESQWDQGTLTITLTQTCRPTAESSQKLPFHIPIRFALFNAQGEEISLDNNLLELRETSQTFSFRQLKEKPILSLLRDFSAPIQLHFNATTDELLTLLRYETNGFAKWDAATRLALNCLTDCYHTQESQWSLPESLLAAFQYVLSDETLNPALRAELLTPPSYEDFASSLSDVDVTRVEAVRDFYRRTLGKALFSDALNHYQQLWQQESHQMDNASFGRRKLRNTCLSLLMKADEARAISLCSHQFKQAKTMTDQVASLSLLVNSSDELARQDALDSFYQQWQHDDLVIDKWFSIISTSESKQTLVQIKTLLTHSAFNIKNPNKVRAVIGAFCQANPRNFHHPDGSGYQFLTDMLLILDPINPQIASRLVTPFTRWQMLNKPRQEAIKEQLNMLSTQNISRDLREMVEKSLVR